MLRRVLIANRGEIAIRIMQACIKLGIPFTAIYTAEDKDAGHVLFGRERGDGKARK